MCEVRRTAGETGQLPEVCHVPSRQERCLRCHQYAQEKQPLQVSVVIHLYVSVYVTLINYHEALFKRNSCVVQEIVVPVYLVNSRGQVWWQGSIVVVLNGAELFLIPV